MFRVLGFFAVFILSILGISQQVLALIEPKGYLVSPLDCERLILDLHRMKQNTQGYALIETRSILQLGNKYRAALQNKDENALYELAKDRLSISRSVVRKRKSELTFAKSYQERMKDLNAGIHQDLGIKSVQLAYENLLSVLENERTVMIYLLGHYPENKDLVAELTGQLLDFEIDQKKYFHELTAWYLNPGNPQPWN